MINQNMLVEKVFEMLKKRETWPIQKFVESVSDGTLTLIKE